MHIKSKVIAFNPFVRKKNCMMQKSVPTVKITNLLLAKLKINFTVEYELWKLRGVRKCYFKQASGSLFYIA